MKWRRRHFRLPLINSRVHCCLCWKKINHSLPTEKKNSSVRKFGEFRNLNFWLLSPKTAFTQESCHLHSSAVFDGVLLKVIETDNFYLAIASNFTSNHLYTKRIIQSFPMTPCSLYISVCVCVCVCVCRCPYIWMSSKEHWRVYPETCSEN
jgi:hypothetical protein